MCLPLCYILAYLVLISATRNLGALRMISLEQFATTSSTTRVLSSHVKVRLAISRLLTFFNIFSSWFHSRRSHCIRLEFEWKAGGVCTPVDPGFYPWSLSCNDKHGQSINIYSYQLSSIHESMDTKPLALRECYGSSVWEVGGSITWLHTYIVWSFSRISWSALFFLPSSYI